MTSERLIGRSLQRPTVRSFSRSSGSGVVVERPWHVALFVVLSAATLVPIWIDTYFPSQNGPWCLLTVHMLHELDNPQFNYSENFEVHWHPIPYLAHTGLVYLLRFVFPLLVANKVALSVYAILLPVSVFYFLAAIDRTKLAYGYLVFVFVLNWPLFRGYHNYCLGLPIYFFTFGYWYKHYGVWNALSFVWMTVLATLCFFSHLFIICMLGFTLSICYLHQHRSVGGYLRNVILPMLPSMLLFLDYVRLNLTSAVWIDTSELTYLPLQTAAESFVRKLFYIYSFPAYVVALVPLALLGLLWGKKLLECVAIYKEGGVRRVFADRFLVVWLALVLLYFALPYQIMGWHYVNSRATPFVLVFGILVTGNISQAWFRPLFVTTVAAASLIVSTATSYEVVRINDRIEEYLAGTDVIQRNKRLLPIMIENPKFGGELRPLTRVFEYYQIETGGVNNNSWGQFNTVTPVWYKTYPIEENFPSFNEADPQGSLARIRKAYDYVLFWGKDERLMAAFRDGGFEPLFRRGKLTIYRNAALFAESDDRGE